ncbi:DUF943 family protein [Erwinia sp. 198]|uniref:DUF943 family protein n=1 Tax=Erwinia sp. 198 TaxID=2022746 RepID=UPI000F6681DB|nr:DUF943 family protein [Erwinia sp. 198]RRZ96849.1 DUF943 family protein [Erwinia sp. 198]
MKIKYKLVSYALLLAGILLSIYALWLTARPVKIVSIHHRSSGFSDVLVKSFPFTDKSKINWWLKNKKILMEKYHVPAPDKNGNFDLTFWSYGEGYKETDGYDRLCFDDMKPPLNCIEKDALFTVNKSPNLGTVFTVYNGGDYRLDKDGNIVEISRK